MKHYVNTQKQIFAFESDGSQDHLITEDMTPITDAELKELTAPPPPTAEDIRNQRDSKLSQSDWRVIKAQETGIAMSQAWQDYRQALRDITNQTGFPENIDWPTEPKE